MKQRILALAVLLSACSKPQQREIINTLFYRIEQTNVNGTVTLSPVKRITPNINSAINDEGEGDDDDDDHGHHTLAIDFESITVFENKSGDIQINWQAESESEVDHYSVQRSTNCADWTDRSFTPVNGTGKYSVLDKN
jgi:hypothetical protein